MKVGVVGNPRYPGLTTVLEQLTAHAEHLGRRGQRHGQLLAARDADRADEARGGVEDAFEVHRLAAQLDLPLGDARDVEQIVDQLGEHAPHPQRLAGIVALSTYLIAPDALPAEARVIPPPPVSRTAIATGITVSSKTNVTTTLTSGSCCPSRMAPKIHRLRVKPIRSVEAPPMKVPTIRNVSPIVATDTPIMSHRDQPFRFFF